MEKELISETAEMMKTWQELFQDGSIIAPLVFAIVITVGLVLRYKGWFVPTAKPESTSVALAPEIKALSSRVALVDQRIADVERDIQHLPTRAEIHEFELGLTRLDGRFVSMENQSKATARAVARIEDFMIDASKRSSR